MAKITYIEPDGTRRTVDVASGVSVMQGAINNNVRGIIAECGGGCSCATCHVYVDDAWMAQAGKKSEGEADMLEAVVDLKPSSRLSCQIEMSDALDGLIVHMPAKQV
jgi:ferredoxin, 2Fe-2S